MDKYNMNLQYNSEIDKIEFIIIKNYEEITSQMFVSQKPNVTDVWRAINNMEMKNQYDFIEKIYENLKNGAEIIELLLAYAEECINNESDMVIKLCEDALLYGMNYNGKRLLDDKREDLKCFIAEIIWHTIELESDTWYTPPKHTRNNTTSLFPGMDGLNALCAAYACNFDEKAEEMYSSNPKMRILIQDRYYY